MTTILKQIKAAGFASLLGAALIALAHAVLTGLTGNAAYPNPSVDLATLKAAIDSYTASLADALDRGKKAILARNTQRAALIKILQSLVRYVEINCKDDLATFMSSGFSPATAAKSVQPLPPAAIVRIVSRASGQLLVVVKSLRHARSYDVRYAALVAGGSPGAWTTVTFTAARKSPPVTGLTPGTTYAFQVRALGVLGYTDWSDSATRVCA